MVCWAWSPESFAYIYWPISTYIEDSGGQTQIEPCSPGPDIEIGGHISETKLEALQRFTGTFYPSLVLGGTDRLGSSSSRYLPTFFIFALAVTFFSQTSWPSSKAQSKTTLETTLESGRRIRQACMLFVSKVAQEHDMGQNVIYERSTRTHIKYAERWGYPNHILRQDIIGQGEWTVLVFGKLLYLQSIIVGELSRPTKERAEWIVYVTLHPTIPDSHQHLHNLFDSTRTPSS